MYKRTISADIIFSITLIQAIIILLQVFITIPRITTRHIDVILLQETRDTDEERGMKIG